MDVGDAEAALRIPGRPADDLGHARMNFASFIFLFWFAPVFLAAYYLLPQRAKNLLLTLVSYGFYGWWRPDYVVLMLISTVIDYTCARAMGAGEGRRRGWWLLLSVCTNLGLLGFF